MGGVVTPVDLQEGQEFRRNFVKKKTPDLLALLFNLLSLNS